MPEKNLAYYLQAFTTLKQDLASAKKNGFAAPHMPILVLSLIQGFERGFLNDERVYLSPELIDLLMKTTKDICVNDRETPAGNSGLEKVAVQCSADTFVVKISTFAKPQNVTFYRIPYKIPSTLRQLWPG